MLSPCEGCGSNWLSTILDKGALNYYCSNDNSQEEEIVEEALEDVILFVSKFSGVDFIKDLHEYESVKDESIVLGLLSWYCIVVGVIDEEGCIICIFQPEDGFSCKQEYNQDCGLEDSLSNNVSPHHSCNNEFSSAIRCFQKKFIARWFSCKGKSSTSIHNQVNPEHLD